MGKLRKEKDVEYLGLFCVLCYQVPCPIPAQFFPCLPFAADVIVESFLDAIHIQIELLDGT